MTWNSFGRVGMAALAAEESAARVSGTRCGFDGLCLLPRGHKGDHEWSVSLEIGYLAEFGDEPLVPNTGKEPK